MVAKGRRRGVRDTVAACDRISAKHYETIRKYYYKQWNINQQFNQIRTSRRSSKINYQVLCLCWILQPSPGVEEDTFYRLEDTSSAAKWRCCPPSAIGIWGTPVPPALAPALPSRGLEWSRSRTTRINALLLLLLVVNWKKTWRKDLSNYNFPSARYALRFNAEIITMEQYLHG